METTRLALAIAVPRRQLTDDDVDAGERGVEHDDAVEDHAGEVKPPSALRPIPEREDELGTDEQDAGVSKDGEDDGSHVVTERVGLRIGEAAGDKVEREVEVGEGEVGEQQLEKLVRELDEEEDLAGDGVVCGEDLTALKEGVDGGEEGAVEPSSALRDEFGDGLPAQDPILGQVHVSREHVRPLPVKGLALEILAQRPVPGLVVLQRVVAIGAQRPRQHGNIAEDGLERLVEDIAHLVLEVLRRHQRVQQVRPQLALHRLNLAAGAGHVGVGIEGLPQVIEGVAPRSRADVEEDADVGVERLAEGVEEPAVRVELALVLLLETEDDLTRHDALLCAFEAQVGVERHLRRILVHVRLHSPVVDVVLGDAVLIDAHGGQGVQRASVDLVSSVRDDTDDDLLPSGLAPGARPRARAEMGNILHDGVHRPREADLVLVIHGDADEQLRLARRPPYALPQLVASCHKVVGVAGDGRVAHVRELDLAPPGEEAVEDGGNLALEHQLAVDQLHLLARHLRRPDASTLLGA
ncbi:hypothetical protein L249_4922, partial [Ophiocordyceps polyrhachis-furcata BCC 54312]